MQCRTFGQLDFKPSALGFGAMRLPIIAGDQAKVDEAEATRMIRYAVDHGVNYVDTAYLYHQGASEAVVGHALLDGYRQRVKLATKLPVWTVKSIEDCDRILDEQLARLQIGCIDFYLFHGLNKGRWQVVRELGLLDWAERAMARGSFLHLGFSFHDRFELFEEILGAYDHWAFCQVQYNYLDHEFQAGTRGVRLAAEKGLGVVVMEPVRGGALANPPPPIQALWATSGRQRTPVDWALQWVWNQPEVSLVLSGMSTFEQVVQNVESAERSAVGALMPDELALAARVREAYRTLRPIPCTECRYCEPCPNGVDIPRIFQNYNDGIMLDARERARFLYTLQNESERAHNCADCGECEDKCPQQIPIRDWLKQADAYLKQ